MSEYESVGGSDVGDDRSQEGETPSAADRTTPPPESAGDATATVAVTSAPTTSGTQTRSRAKVPTASPLHPPLDESARRGGEAAEQLNHIRALLDAAAEGVAAATLGNARLELTEEELRHDVQEMDVLRREILDFQVNNLGRSWRAGISGEIHQRAAALETAMHMLQARTTAAAQPSARARRHSVSLPVGAGAEVAVTTGEASMASTPPTSNASAYATAALRTAPTTSTTLSPTQTRLLGMSLGTAPVSGASTSISWSQTTRGTRPGPPAVRAARPPQSRQATGGLGTAGSPTMSSLPSFPYPPPPVGTALPPTQPAVGTSTARPLPSQGLLPRPVQEEGRVRSPLAAAGATATWAAPSWMAAPTTPYGPGTCELGPEYYLSFPYPWNSVPQEKDTKVNDILKVTTQSLPKFGGDRRAYITWRNSFIPGVHLAILDVSYKIMLLRNCMLPTNARMREFINSIVGSPEGYRQAICTLEERYGGAAALLMTRQEDLMALPEVREGEFRVVETLHMRLGTFLLEWEGITGAPLSERESLAYYLSLMGKIEPTYARKYLEWTEQAGVTENLRSLHNWLTGELRRHRRVDVYGLPKGSVPRGSRPHPPEGGGGGRTGGAPPAGVLDRNYPRPQTFFVADDGSDELETPLLGEEESPPDPIHACVGRTTDGGASRTTPRPPCTLCGADHGLGGCPKFRELTPSGRKELLIKENRCFLCFQKGHNVARCRFTFRCTKCERRHHTLLHGAETEGGRTFFTLEEVEEDIEGATEALEYGLLTALPAAEEREVTPQNGRVSLRTLPVLITNPETGESAVTNAMLDDGCTAGALLSRSLAQRLRLKGQVRWTSTEGVGGLVTRYQTLLSCVKVAHVKTKAGRLLPAQVMENPAGSYTPIDWSREAKYHSHLKHIYFHPPAPDVGVEVMIGNLCAALTASQEEVIGGEADPVARRTELGWTAVGPVTVPQADPVAFRGTL